MCVAVIMEPGAELSVDEVVRMSRANGDGVGFAWADGEVVQWLKAIKYSPEKVAGLINRTKDHFRLVHFRLSTAGGVRAELCHPFEIGPLASCSHAGSGNKVLIHNGHWRRWTDVFDLMKKEETLPDLGPWSDTRLAALMASWDMDWLDTVDGKVAVMDGEGNVKMYGTWDTLRPGVKVSNTSWQAHTYAYTKSGRDRHMMGWGWTEKEWEEYEKHQEVAAKDRAKKEMDDEEREKEKGEGKEAGGGEVGMVAGRKDRKLLPSHNSGGGDNGGANGARNGKGKDVPLAEGPQENEIYDHIPWQNPSTKKWWWITWASEVSGRARVEEISESRSREILEQITAARAAGRTQG